MDFSVIWNNLDLLFASLGTTVVLTIQSIAVGFILAVILVMMRQSGFKIFSKTAYLFIYFFRGTPLLVQLYLIYYGVGQLGFIKEMFLWEYFKHPYFCALLSLALNNAAYTAEIFLGAIRTTRKADVESATAFGMSKIALWWHIIIPTAMRRSLPTYSNEVIFMLHATSLCSTITIVDLTGAARIINSTYFSPFEAFIGVGFFYLAVTMLLVFVFRIIEKRVNRHLMVGS